MSKFKSFLLLNFLFALLVITSAVIMAGCISPKQPEVLIEPEVTPTTTIQEIPTPIPVPVQTETPYPKPSYIPALRSYNIDKSHDIWHAKDPTW